MSSQDDGEDEPRMVFSQESDISMCPAIDDDEDLEVYSSTAQIPSYESFRTATLKHSATVYSSTVFSFEAGLSMKIAEDIPFQSFCNLMEMLHNERGTKRKDALLSEFLQRNGMCNNHPLNTHVFPLVRLFLPENDNGRPRYYVKERGLSKMYQLALRLPSSVGQRLDKFADPFLNDQPMSEGIAPVRNGTFPNVLKSVLDVWFPQNLNSSLTCKEVNNFLDRIHDAVGIVQKSTVLREMVFHCQSAVQHEWIARIILKCIPGMDSNTLLRAFHPDAPRGLHVLGDLRRTLAMCAMSESVQFTYEMFCPGRPMLASRTRIDLSTARLGDFIIEEKLDGDRMMVHLDKAKKQYRLFTRNQKDFTNVYGVDPLVSALFESFDCVQCILDGEMVAYDKDDILRNGQCNNASVAREMFRAGSSSRYLSFFAFDVMYIQQDPNLPGRDLTCLALWERKAFLSRIFRSAVASPYVQLVRPMQVVRDVRDLDERHAKVMEQLDYIIRNRREGLVLKSLDARYSLAGRSPLWVKVKPDYVGNLSQGLDCIVLGGEYHEEKHDRVFHHVKHVSRLLFGLRYRHPTASGYTYKAFCETGIGLTKLDFMIVHRAFEVKGVLSSEERPTHFRWNGKTPVWLRPEDSFIVEVTGTQMFERFRFPYIRSIRHDKDWDECATEDECDSRFQQGYRFSSLRAVDIKRKDFHGKPKQQHGKEMVPKVAEIDVQEMKRESYIFQGKTFLVANGDYPGGQSKHDVENLVRRHGGMCLDIFDRKQADYWIAADTLQASVSNAIKFAKDCPKIFAWPFLVDCVAEGRLIAVPNRFQHLVHVGATSQKRVKHDMDEFCDSFKQDATAESLTISLHLAAKFSEKKEPVLDESESAALNLALGRFLLGMRVKIECGSRALECLVNYHGGAMVNIEAEATHVVVKDGGDKPEYEPRRVALMVTKEWMYALLQQCAHRLVFWSDVKDNEGSK